MFARFKRHRSEVGELRLQVERYRRMLVDAECRTRDAETALRKFEDNPTVYCSFCGKSRHKVAKLISGPMNIFICNECVLLCVEIIKKEGK